MTPGFFLVLEGGEGAGKSTQARLLGEWLTSLDLPHVVAREPGGTPVGEAIRRVVLDKGDLTMPPETELFLILGARAAFTREVVQPALQAGKIVVADRYDLSTFAYQGYGRGLDLLQVAEANRIATGGLVPDCCLVLDLSVAEGLARKGGVAQGDRIEKSGDDFLARVYGGYRALAEARPEARLVPADGDPDVVQARLRALLSDAFPETFPSATV